MKILELFETIQEIGPSAEQIVYYTSEGCGSFACALWIAYGKPGNGTIGIISNADGEPWSRSIPFEVTHAFYEEGNKTIDVGGVRSVDDMVEELYLGAGYNYEGSYSPDNFRKRFMGNSRRFPLYGGRKEIQEALNLIMKHKKFYGIQEKIEELFEPMAKAPTIADGTKANGEIDRKVANKMVDPKGYFKSKAPYLSETDEEQLDELLKPRTPPTIGSAAMFNRDIEKQIKAGSKPSKPGKKPVKETVLRLALTTRSGNEINLKIYHNPTAKILASVVANSKDKEVRGLVTSQHDAFFWDAYDAQHRDVVNLLRDQGFDLEAYDPFDDNINVLKHNDMNIISCVNRTNRCIEHLMQSGLFQFT